MITFTPIASSSAGNAYLVEDQGYRLLLECGVSIHELRRATGFGLSSLDGCLLSHHHGDHAKAAKELMKSGVDVYASAPTFEALGITGHRAIVIEPMEWFKINRWRIIPIPAHHDAEGTMSYLISGPSFESMIFITDSFYSTYRYEGLSIIAVECNFAGDILDANIAAGRVPSAMKSRLLKSHFSLENVKSFLRANDKTMLRAVHLMHLSDTNSDEERFKREISEIVGVPVYVAGR